MSNFKKHSDREIFSFFLEQSNKNVQGVFHISSSKPGPIVGITACTHGNEPAGLAAFSYLLHEVDVEKNLLRGELYLIVNNIRAAEKYFEGDSLSRFIDINMNRLPIDIQEAHTSENYEIARARELLPIWKKFTHGLDIHSTRSEMKPMIIGRENTFHSGLIEGIPIDTLISNIDKIQINKPAFFFYGQKPSDQVFAIEAGSHESPTSFERATAASTIMLENLDMLKKTHRTPKKEYTEYKVRDSILFPNFSYNFAPGIEDFKKISKGTVIATDGGDNSISMPFDGCVILKTTPKNRKELTEEVAFLTTCPKKRIL
ncbi:MAG: succinylglutamate desuccinylase/aspartoacylase family protein [Candidatus Paceibacterota bacterium]